MPESTDSMLRKNKIVLLGAGNVATHLGMALREKGFPIIQVYSRTLSAAEDLGKKLQTAYTDDLQAVFLDADIYLFALKDSALSGIAPHLPPLQGLWVHTGGSVSLDVFSSYAERRGVLYPLQTFSRNRKIVFQTIPICIEANRPDDEDLLETIACKLSDRVVRISSEKRQYLHLAAVFACNFTNHLYARAAEILESRELDWELLLPLIRETASKVENLHPTKAQTGPAVRQDRNVMDRHLELLETHPDIHELYRLLSKSIYQF
jgi:predicted short-subunit dehydrogenase-like oxidoreductase (DUF2520 family)